MNIPDPVHKIVKSLTQAGGRCLLVGGAVRDHLMGRPVKDYDLEVYHLPFDSLKKSLSELGPSKEVGVSFGVIKVWCDGMEVDVALPRFETKTGPGHRGFEVSLAPDASYESAAKRRDFTMNSMGFDPVTDTLLDPYNGQADIKAAVIRHVSDAFSEDPLRVLRAMQFSARFQMNIHPSTMSVCQRLDLKELAKDRILREFEQLLLKAPAPSWGLKLASQMGVWTHFDGMKAVSENPEHWQRTCENVDQMALARSGDDHTDRVMMAAALCESLSGPDTRRFLGQLTQERALIQGVRTLIENKSAADDCHQAPSPETAVRHLATRVKIQVLAPFLKALARDPEQQKRVTWLSQTAQTLGVDEQPLPPLLTGADLKKLGVPPGKQMGELLEQVYEQQLNGQVQEKSQAISFLKGVLGAS